jgi:hypothetical protein
VPHALGSQRQTVQQFAEQVRELKTGAVSTAASRYSHTMSTGVLRRTPDLPHRYMRRGGELLERKLG